MEHHAAPYMVMWPDFRNSYRAVLMYAMQAKVDSSSQHWPTTASTQTPSQFFQRAS